MKKENQVTIYAAAIFLLIVVACAAMSCAVPKETVCQPHYECLHELTFEQFMDSCQVIMTRGNYEFVSCDDMEFYYNCGESPQRYVERVTFEAQ